MVAPVKGVIALPKSHACLLGLAAFFVVAICLALTLLAQAAAPTSAPAHQVVRRPPAPSFTVVGRRSGATHQLPGRPLRHDYIGHKFPLAQMVKARQTPPGPVPDTDLTPNAVVSSEHSPNGSPNPPLNQVAFSSNGVDINMDGQIDATFPADYTPDYNIWTMRPDGSQQIMVTFVANSDLTKPRVGLPGDQIEPAYSPSGLLIAFAGNQTGQWEIYTVEVRSIAAGTPVIRALTVGQPGNKRHPTWSPDSNWVAYACDAGGNWDIYKYPVAGGAAQTQITNSPDDKTQPAWVPARNNISLNATAIAFTDKVGGVTRIEYVDTTTGTIDALTDGGGDALANDADPAWSQDGRYMAFASDRLRAGTTTRNFNIWRMGDAGEISGGTPTLVSDQTLTHTTDSRSPSFSAPVVREPQRIYYESNRADGTGLTTDIWATQFTDTAPPYLTDLPSLDHRQLMPGDDAVFHVPVFDADSGVQHVYVHVKDPDQKVYVQTTWAGWDSGVDGLQYTEWDYKTVATLELFDDGDPTHGDAKAGDGIFSGIWTTPAGTGHDYVIDVDTVDNAGNEQNYDSVYGFSTLTFTPSSHVLLVNDYCEGQHYIFENQNNNDYPTAWYTESFYTYNPGYPIKGAPAGDFDSIRGYALDNGTDEPYDLWRIICRGTVPPTVYQYYLPTVEYQLDPTAAVANPVTATASRAVPVAQRAVIWAAPHTGDVWVADGSLVDAGTQADLGLFLDRGGRLFVSGQDIAWALTLNGTVSNNFLSKYLRATFLSDVGAGTGGYTGNYFMVGLATDLVAGDPWGGGHYGFADEMPVTLDTPMSEGYTREDASDESFRPDGIQEQGAGTVKLYGYGSATGTTAGLRYENTGTSAKVVFLAFGFEAIHRGYVSNPAHCENHRSHLFHNSLCWMRTGCFQGTVLDIAGKKPLHNPNPIVRFYLGGHQLGAAGTPDYAVRVQDDGTFVANGLKPGIYSIEAFRPGYQIDHRDGDACHGGWAPPVIDFAISQSPPGAIAGTITSKATGGFVNNADVKVWAVPPPPTTTGSAAKATSSSPAATVKAAQTTGAEPIWSTLGPPLAEVLSGVDGTYKVDGLPPGSYYVLCDGTPTYGTAWAQVTVTAGNTTIQNFQLTAANGTLVATVTDITTSNPIQNALVQAASSAGVVVGSGTTAADGTVTISLQPGTFTVSATAAGYQPSPTQSVTITSGSTSTVAFKLQTQAPGSITGLVTTASSGTPVGGVLMKILSNGVVVGTTTTAATITVPPDGSGSYNYRFTNVPTGSIVVQPAPVGFTATPTSQTVTVVSGLVTPSVNFTLTSLHTFPAGVQLVSLPYDYSGLDPAVVLNVTSGLTMATWESSTQRYRLYPNAPADRFRLGTGYWLDLPKIVDVTIQGPASGSPAPIALGVGWNLVGDPFPTMVDFFNTYVVDATSVRYTMEQALGAGLIQGSMFVYTLGGYQTTAVFSPWVGDWLLATAPLTLYVNGDSTASAVRRAARPAVATPEGGWLVNLETSLGGLKDTATYFGAAPGGAAGYSRTLDAPKPPAVTAAPTVYTAFAHPDWGAQAGNYAVDMRSLSPKSTWPLVVWTNLPGSTVTLRWPDLTHLPATVKPVLRDLTTGSSVYMRTSSSYSFKAGTEYRQFEIRLADPGAGALAVTAVTAQQVSDGRCQVRYELAGSAAVSVEVVNLAGRPVRSLASALQQEAGPQVVPWDGRNAAGAKAPAGRYLVRVTARSASGQQTQVVTGLWVR